MTSHHRRDVRGSNILTLPLSLCMESVGLDGPSRDLGCQAVKDFNRQWLGQKVRKLLRRDDPLDRHMSLSEEHQEVPVFLINVLGSWPDSGLSCNCNGGGVVLKHPAMNFSTSEVDVNSVQIGIRHQVDEKDIFSGRL